MYPRSAAFDDAVQNSHVMATLCELRDPANGDALLATFDITDGNITVDDDSQSSRRTADLNLVDPTGELIMDELGDLLSPATNEVWLYRGIKFPNGTTELINQGVFPITKHIVDDSGAGLQIRLSLVDRAHTVAVHTLIRDTSFPSGTQYVGAITALIQTAMPSVVFNIQGSISDTMGGTFYETGDDPWKAATQLAVSIGCELFFDTSGNCVLRRIPDIAAQDPLWTFAEGIDSTVLYFNKQVDDDNFANHVIVIGQSPNGTTPVRGEWSDTNTSSPTWIGGRYGDRAVAIKDSSIKDGPTAGSRAFAEFQLRSGLSELTYISCIVHPVFELLDVVELSRVRAKISGNYSVNKISVPMTNDRPMYLTMQKRLVTS
jgi:hypothetical protein